MSEDVDRDSMAAERRSVLPFDDLPGRVQAVAAVGFFALWAVIVFVPRLWGADVLYEHYYAVGGVLAVLWWPTVAHVGPRFAARQRDRGAVVAGGPTADARALRKARRTARRYAVQRASAWLIAPMFVAAYLIGQDSADYDAELLASQPTQTVYVVAVEWPVIHARGEGPEITVDVDGRTVTLGQSFPGEERVAPGDRIAVVVDPDAPEYVLAANSHDDWAYTWWGDLLLWLGIAGLGGGLWLLWALSTPARPARAAARCARTAHVVELVGVDGARLELRDAAGGVWAWTGDDDTWSGPRHGHLRVLGELTDGAWLLIETRGRLYWPVEGATGIGSKSDVRRSGDR